MKDFKDAERKILSLMAVGSEFNFKKSIIKYFFLVNQYVRRVNLKQISIY